MNPDRINRWLTLGANIGVVLGLVILILEMRQNAAISRAAIDVQKSSLLAQIELSLTSPETAAAWMKSIRQPEELTDVEIRIIDGHLAAVTLQWDYAFQMEAAGLIGRKQVENHIRNSAQFYFGSAFGKNWYSLQAIGWNNTIMSEVADPIVASLDERFMEKYYDKLHIAGRNRDANKTPPSTP